MLSNLTLHSLAICLVLSFHFAVLRCDYSKLVAFNEGAIEARSFRVRQKISSSSSEAFSFSNIAVDIFSIGNEVLLLCRLFNDSSFVDMPSSP